MYLCHTYVLIFQKLACRCVILVLVSVFVLYCHQLCLPAIGKQIAPKYYEDT